MLTGGSGKPLTIAETGREAGKRLVGGRETGGGGGRLPVSLITL